MKISEASPVHRRAGTGAMGKTDQRLRLARSQAARPRWSTRGLVALFALLL